MNNQLLDYLLDRLDKPARLQVATRLQVDESARRQLELLRQALLPLAADDEITAPPHLSVRTIARVAEYACRQLPVAPAPARTESAGRPWWRRADMLVAASLLAVFAGIGIPLIARMRTAPAIVECQENLRQFHVALRTYEDTHKQPFSLEKAPRSVAGIVVPMLQNDGVLPRDFNVRCPGQGAFLACSLTLEQIKNMSAEQFAQHAPNLLASYAFTLGYRDDNGVWHPVNRTEDAADNSVLIFADNPPPNVVAGNSLNHGGRGQNVLFHDGHAQFIKIRTYDRDDIYLNNDKLVAAGNGSRDFVLGNSASKP
jgi:prepilin-type processing-associated H-X9-DG protein